MNPAGLARAGRRGLVAGHRGLVAGLGAVVLVLLMVFAGTTVVDPAEAKKAQTRGLDPTAFAAKNYSSKIAPTIVDQATDMGEVATALRKDREAAVEKYGVRSGTSNPVFSVSATGTAGKVDAGGLMPVKVPAMPDGSSCWSRWARRSTAPRSATRPARSTSGTSSTSWRTRTRRCS